MPAFRLFLMAASSLSALALFTVAGDSLLRAWQGEWMMALDGATATATATTQANVAAAALAALMTQVRQYAAAGAAMLGVVVVLGFYDLVRRVGPALAHHDRMIRAVQDHELLLLSQYRDLSLQLSRCRDTLADDMGMVGESTEHMRGAQEIRFASIEAGLKRMDDTLVEQLEGLAAQVSHTLQWSESKRLADQVRSAEHMGQPVAEAQVASLSNRLAQRLDHIESLLQRQGGQLTVLNQQIDRSQSANVSQFGELPASVDKAPEAPSATALEAMQSLMINLADLQVDLRAERRALRKRLNELPRTAAAG
ncbi:MAG: hypothetical protein AB9M60_00185 [Leptothrix sp. (in: b-proteobacteria)]